MDEQKTFIDELLEEVESKERTLHLAHADLILGEISNLEKNIVHNFEQTDEEKAILDTWVLQKNSKLLDRIEYLKRKLESFMNEQGKDVKTIDLPNGKLLKRKQPDKVEIYDMDKFITNENLNLLGTLRPEQLEPNLNMIKAYINKSKRLPNGVKVIKGKDKFSIKLNKQTKEKD